MKFKIQQDLKNSLVMASNIPKETSSKEYVEDMVGAHGEKITNPNVNYVEGWDM